MEVGSAAAEGGFDVIFEANRVFVRQKQRIKFALVCVGAKTNGRLFAIIIQYSPLAADQTNLRAQVVAIKNIGMKKGEQMDTKRD